MTPLWFWEVPRAAQGVWVGIYRVEYNWFGTASRLGRVEVSQGAPIKYVRIG